MKKSFDQNEYTKEYNKTHYKQFKTELPIEEKEIIDKFLKENNITKIEFIRNAFKKEKLKREIKDIISKFHTSEFSKEIHLNNGKKETLNNGIIISMYTFPVLNNDKMLVVKIEFNNDVLYAGTVNYNYFSVIKKNLEQLDTTL